MSDETFTASNGLKVDADSDTGALCVDNAPTDRFDARPYPATSYIDTAQAIARQKVVDMPLTEARISDTQHEGDPQ